MDTTLTVLWNNGLLWALIAALGGTILRYAGLYKAGQQIKLSVLNIDIVISLFIGFYSFWYIYEELNLNAIHSSLINIVLGYTGVDIMKVVKVILTNKVATQFNVNLDKLNLSKQRSEDNNETEPSKDKEIYP
mgnify:CR=1 FL=1